VSQQPDTLKNRQSRIPKCYIYHKHGAVSEYYVQCFKTVLIEYVSKCSYFLILQIHL